MAPTAKPRVPAPAPRLRKDGTPAAPIEWEARSLAESHANVSGGYEAMLRRMFRDIETQVLDPARERRAATAQTKEAAGATPDRG